MTAPMTDVLCTRCGLCCDGVLFGDVEITDSEALTLEVLGLDVEDDGDHAVLGHPCRALKGRRCTIYAHRPGACQAFECHLLQRAERGQVSAEDAMETITDALRQVEHVRGLIASLGQNDERLSLKERCAEALAMSEGCDADGEVRSKRAELEAAMGSVERLIRDAFVGKQRSA